MNLSKTSHLAIYSMSDALIPESELSPLHFEILSVTHISHRYLAINHHLAELIQKIFTPDVSSRKANILLARDHYDSFLKLLDSYDILGASDCKLLEVYREDKANFSTASTRDAAARRDAKIARFREEKELKRKLEVRPLMFAFSRHESRVAHHLLTLSSTFNKTPSSPRTMNMSFAICI